MRSQPVDQALDTLAALISNKIEPGSNDYSSLHQIRDAIDESMIFYRDFSYKNGMLDALSIALTRAIANVNAKRREPPMDPNATLKQLRELYREALHFDAQDGNPEELMQGLAEQAEALDQWITRGGFLPSEWQQGRTITT